MSTYKDVNDLNDPYWPFRDRCLAQWIKDYDSGMFDSEDVSVQSDAGWYDWFCKDSSLAGKTRRLSGSVKRIAKSPKVDVENNYVFFKNNRPMSGPLYDDFIICDIETGDVIFTITPRSGHNGKSEVWGAENNFKEPLASGEWKDVISYFFPNKK